MILPNSYLKKPFTTDYNELNIFSKFAIAVFWLLAFTSFSGFIVKIIESIYSYYDLNISLHIFNKHAYEIINKYGYTNTLFYIIIIGPLIEELIFRLPLSFTRRSVIISSSTIVYVILHSIVNLYFDDSPIYGNLPLISFIITYVLLDNSNKTTKLIEKLKFSYSTLIIYSSSILFALVHLTNLDSYSFNELPIYIIAILSYTSMGLIFSFVRIHISFFASALLHSLWNGFVFMMLS